MNVDNKLDGKKVEFVVSQLLKNNLENIDIFGCLFKRIWKNNLDKLENMLGVTVRCSEGIVGSNNWILNGVDVRDIYFKEERLEQGRNFMNKLWNCSRFILMNIEDNFNTKITDIDIQELDETDKWILSKLNKIIKDQNKIIKIQKNNINYSELSIKNITYNKKNR